MRKSLLTLGFATLVASQAFLLTPVAAQSGIFGAAASGTTAIATTTQMASAPLGGPVPVFYEGALTGDSLTFNNPGGQGAGNQHYCVQEFTVDAAGAYTIEMASPNTTGTPSDALDTFLRLHATAFDPLNPAGALASNDDFSGTLTVLPGPYAGIITSTGTGFQGAQPSSRVAAANLAAGTQYFLVHTTWPSSGNAQTGTAGQPVGAFYTGISGPGAIALGSTDCGVSGGGDPVIGVAPLALNFTVVQNTTDSDDLAISNNGGGVLEWEIAETTPLQAGRGGPSQPLIGFNFTTAAAPIPDPQNWNRISAVAGPVSNVQDDTGTPTPVSINWGDDGPSAGFLFLSTSTLAANAVPQYDYSLAGMTGYAFRASGQLFIELSGLEANADYEFWFVAYRATAAIQNVVSVSNGDVINATQFTQSVSAANNNGNFIVNDVFGSDTQQWNDLAFVTTSSSTGTIRFNWVGDGQTPVIGALAVRQLAGGCEFPTDVPWLSVGTAMGSTAAGATDLSAISVDATGLAPGNYAAQLCVTSNDPVTPLVEVPVSLQVDPPGLGTEAIAVAPTSLSFSLPGAGTAVDELTISNVGGGNLIWDIETDDVPQGGGYNPALDETLAVPDFAIASAANGGAPAVFTVPAGVMTSGAVVGFSFEGTVAGITGTSSWASDMCLRLEGPDGSTYDVGGFSAAIPGCDVNAWDFDGSGSTNDGTYASQHFDAFTFPPGAQDAGDWTLTFTNGWNNTSAATMSWSNVTVTLHKQSVGAACDNPAAVPWLSVDPVAGNTFGGESSLVDVMVDSTGLAAGTYEAALCINSNDSAGNDLVVVPVELTIGASEITVDPETIVASADAGDSTTEILTIGNIGDGVLEWEIEEAPAGTLNPRAHFPLQPWPVRAGGSGSASGEAEPADQAFLDKLALGGSGITAAPDSRSSWFRGGAAVPAFTFTGFSRTDYVTLDAAVPGVLTSLSGPAVARIFAATFVNNDFSQQYAITSTPSAPATVPANTYGTVDTANGVFTPIGLVTGATGGGPVWAGLKWDATTSTLFAASNSILFTIDVATGAATPVGPISGGGLGAAPLVIDIAIAPDGLMYGLDIVDDVLFAIDKTTGAAAVIGPVGINANFAQGMDFDQSDGTLYWAAYAGGGNSNMTTIDLATGAASVIGPIEGGAELTSLSIAVAGGNCANPADVPWLSVDQASGTIPAGGQADEVTVTLDAAGLSDGIYEASLCVLSNDLSRPRVEVPVVFTVGDPVGGAADLALSLFGVPSTVNAGGDVSLVATVANFGPSPATNVVVELTLPAEFTFVSGSLIEGSGNWNCSAVAQLVTCELVAGALPVGAFSAVLQVEVAVDAGAASGVVVTTGMVSASGSDPNPANNTASVNTTIVGAPADLIFANGFECAAGFPGCATGGTPGFYTDRTTFLDNVQAGFYEEDFATVPGGAAGPLLSFTNGTFSYDVTVVGAGSNNLFNGTGFISTDSAVDAIRVTFTGAPVTAIGGNFWATDINFAATGGEIILTLEDGTVQSYSPSSATSFGGFVTVSPIVHITIDAPEVAPVNNWSTMDNVIVGAR